MNRIPKEARNYLAMIGRAGGLAGKGKKKPEKTPGAYHERGVAASAARWAGHVKKDRQAG